jgi:hypothetical protein
MELECASQKFEHIARKLLSVFYFFAALDCVTISVSIVFTAYEYTLTAVILESLSTFLSTIIIVVPIRVLARECEHAIATLAPYKRGNRPLPLDVYSKLVSINTVFFKNPMLECSRLHEKVAPPHMISSTIDIAELIEGSEG